MPLVNDDPEIIPNVPENGLTPITPRPGQRPSGEFKNSVVDIRERSIQSLLAHVEGSKWQIDYYRQLLTLDMMPVSNQPLQNIPYQQYEKINHYILTVTSPLSSSQNNDTALFTVTGTAILALAIIPNIGDIFIADIGDGRYGVFSIDSFTRKTILKDSVFEINYILISYDIDEISEDLNSKVVRELYFSEDHIGAGRGPLISDYEFHQYRTINHRIKELIQSHTLHFLDKNNSILLRPEDGQVYDPYFSIFWDKIIDKEYLVFGQIPRVLLVGDEYQRYYTIWDCLLERNIDYLNLSVATKLNDCFNTFTDLIYNGIALTDVDKLVSIDENFLIPTPYKDDNSDDSKARFNFTNVNYHPVNSFGYYVLSYHFYLNEKTKFSKLEYLVSEYLKSKPLNLEIYNSLIATIMDQGELEKFYYIPILVILGVDHLRRVS